MTDELPARSWSDQWLYLQAFVVLPLVGIALKMATFERVRSLLAATLPQRSPAENAARSAGVDVAEIARVVGIVAGSPSVPGNSLRHALALWWLLAQRGVACGLRFGVKKDGEKLLAHAWVEHDGVVLNDEQDIAERYLPIG